MGLSGLALCVFAVAALAADTPQRMKELTALVGLDAVFNSNAEAMHHWADKVPAKVLDPEKYRKIVTAAAKMAFSAEDMKQKLRNRLASTLSSSDVDQLIDWYRRPVGVHMTQLEDASQSQKALADVRWKADELRRALKDEPERAALIDRLEILFKDAETTANILLSNRRAMTLGAAAANERSPSLPIDAINRELERLRPALLQELKKDSKITLAHTYREASVEELRDYVAFLESPLHRSFYDTAVQAMENVMARCATEFGRYIYFGYRQ